MDDWRMSGRRLVRQKHLLGRRSRGWVINLYRSEPALRWKRDGRYMLIVLGTIAVEWYPA
jgi:hypothetical protein